MKGIEHWLKDRGSLIAKLKWHGLQPRITVLNQSWQYPHEDECRLLKIPDRRYGLVREVLIRHGSRPLAYGRSIAPISTITGPERQLLYTGQRSLGSYLFAHRDMTRSPLEQISSHLAEYSSEELLGRRSIFYLTEKPLLLTEIFLPELVDFANDHPTLTPLRALNAFT